MPLMDRTVESLQESIGQREGSSLEKDLETGIELVNAITVVLYRDRAHFCHTHTGWGVGGCNPTISIRDDTVRGKKRTTQFSTH